MWGLHQLLKRYSGAASREFLLPLQVLAQQVYIDTGLMQELITLVQKGLTLNGTGTVLMVTVSGTYCV